MEFLAGGKGEAEIGEWNVGGEGVAVGFSLHGDLGFGDLTDVVHLGPAPGAGELNGVLAAGFAMFVEHGDGLAFVRGEKKALIADDGLAAFGIGFGIAGELEIHGVAGGEEIGPVAAVVHPGRGVLHFPAQMQERGVGAEIDLRFELAAFVPSDCAREGGLTGGLLRGGGSQALTLGGGNLGGGDFQFAALAFQGAETFEFIDAIRSVADLHEVTARFCIATEAAAEDFAAEAILIF